jgi:hypothetical protein
MTATEIIQQIEQLPDIEQAEVIRFVNQLWSRRRLSGKDLTALAKEMVETSDPDAQEALRERIVEGFYGEKKDA